MVRTNNQHRKCPRCNHRNFHDENYCENCLAPLTRLNVQEYYMRWDISVMSK
ncbi:hypothetical protein H6503_05610 [Candidatus Woesearchaeota archaeon]|nr:hypothetical protein [Candidatus Woesearchaeota archaeon]